MVRKAKKTIKKERLHKDESFSAGEFQTFNGILLFILLEETSNKSIQYTHTVFIYSSLRPCDLTF